MTLQRKMKIERREREREREYIKYNDNKQYIYRVSSCQLNVKISEACGEGEGQ